MELADYFDECAWTSELFHDSPQSIPADSVESLGKVDEGRVEVAVLLYALFLELAGGKYHICGASTCTETALALWEVTLFQVSQQAIEEDTCQDLASYRQKGYSSMVVARLSVSFPFVDVDDCCISELLWQGLLVPHGLEEAGQLAADVIAAHLVHLSWNGVRSRSFPAAHLHDCFVHFSLRWRSIKLLVSFELWEPFNSLGVDLCRAV